jgi:hypothetical protein
MNNSFVLRTAERLASRVQQESGGDPSRQVDRAFALAFSRKPDGDELQWATQFMHDHGLTALCRVLLNSNEFLYVD